MPLRGKGARPSTRDGGLWRLFNISAPWLRAFRKEPEEDHPGEAVKRRHAQTVRWHRYCRRRDQPDFDRADV
ncbi:MAG TPA: hypothetical protein GXZ36_07900 [Firmicutes bacterium]|nr:hypothetical protein [Bacillota bacterium]